MATTGNLTAKQHAAIAALLTARDVRAAAHASGVGPRTLYRWIELPHFAAALQAAQDELIDGATRRLATLLGSAAVTMAEIMADKGNSPGVRLRAAEAVISNHMRLREYADLAERVEALEEALGRGTV